MRQEFDLSSPCYQGRAASQRQLPASQSPADKHLGSAVVGPGKGRRCSTTTVRWISLGVTAGSHRRYLTAH